MSIRAQGVFRASQRLKCLQAASMPKRAWTVSLRMLSEEFGHWTLHNDGSLPTVLVPESELFEFWKGSQAEKERREDAAKRGRKRKARRAAGRGRRRAEGGRAAMPCLEAGSASEAEDELESGQSFETEPEYEASSSSSSDSSSSSSKEFAGEEASLSDSSNSSPSSPSSFSSMLGDFEVGSADLESGEAEELECDEAVESEEQTSDDNADEPVLPAARRAPPAAPRAVPVRIAPALLPHAAATVFEFGTREDQSNGGFLPLALHMPQARLPPLGHY